MILYILLFICFFSVIVIKSKKSFHMLQQNLYNENNRYLKWINKSITKLINIDIIGIFVCIFIYFCFSNNEQVCNIALVALIIIYTIECYILINNQHHEQVKKPLAVTARIKRLIITNTIIYLLLIGLIFYISDQDFTWIIISVFATLITCNSIVVFISNIINYPIERTVYFYYYSKAKKKLLMMNNLKVVGITGSYGKTSSKNILNTILGSKYLTLPSPKNYNTEYGLMITINNYLDKFSEIFIAEMGAYAVKDIQKLCNFVKPKYAILTTIGPCHLESFGSLENIITGKFELIESLPSDGVGILNMDDVNQVNYQLQNKCKIIWIGIENQSADVIASNIKCDNEGTSFNVTFKGDSQKYFYHTKLLGRHNVYNILESIALGRELGISPLELIDAVNKVNPIEHRLELKRLGDFYQIDDAYNSNPVGAKEALNILDKMKGIKVVVTPGMIELGDQEYDINKEFGQQISKVADYVILIGSLKTIPIYDGLIENNYDENRIIRYNDVKEAFTFLNNLQEKKDIYALFENDLPDTYNEEGKR